MAPHRLAQDAVQARLAQTEGWAVRSGRLHKCFEFSDFATAFGFMASVALVAERMNHHPQWSNVCNRVEVELVTHDADGITELDFVLAQRMDELARRN